MQNKMMVNIDETYKASQLWLRGQLWEIHDCLDLVALQGGDPIAVNMVPKKVQLQYSKTHLFGLITMP